MKSIPVIVATLAIIAVVGAGKEVRCIHGCKCTYTDASSPSKLRITRCPKNISLVHDVFATLGMGKLDTLEFAGVVIERIDNTAFYSLKYLETLQFNNSFIGKVAVDAFNLPHLEKLRFSHCSFNSSVEFDAVNLQELVITNCKVNKVPNFGNLPALNYLDLSNNDIKKIAKDAFSGFDNLETLKLSGNNITMLTPDVFKDISTLGSLYLDNNPLRYFSLSSELTLEYLSMKNCKLSTFDEKSTKYLSSLTDLILSGNKIAFLPNKAFENMTDLTNVDLSSNNLKHLDANIFKKNRRLSQIILDRNNFVSLPPFNVAGGTFSTTYFSCKECQLVTLSNDTFKHMPSIQLLDLSGNYLTNIDHVFQHVPGLVELDVSSNKIVEISVDAFSGNLNLKSINLSGNFLRAISPKIFENNKLLRKLDISEAGLNHIWLDDRTVLKSLETISIFGNKISRIRESELNVTPHLRNIYLENNPLNCSEDLKEAFKWFVRNKVLRLVETEDEMNDFIISDDIHSTWKDLARRICPGEILFTTPSVTRDYVTNANILGHDDKLYDNEDYDYDDDDDDDDVQYDEDEDEDVEEDEDNAVKKIAKPNLVTKHPFVTVKEVKKENREIEDYENDMAYDAIQDIEFDDKYSLTKTSYVFLVTAIFILTALLVVVTTVSLTLFFLRKNRTINIHRANLPRLKIPRWTGTPTHKKHSGSVYQTLTEEYYGPKTPKVTRCEYQFSATPTVHNNSSNA